MEENNDNQASQPNGNENGIKRPHEGGSEHNHNHEPDAKRARVDSSNDADSQPTQPKTNSANGSGTDKPTLESSCAETTSAVKSEEGTLKSEAKVQGEMSENRAPPRGTAVIKPE